MLKLPTQCFESPRPIQARQERIEVLDLVQRLPPEIQCKIYKGVPPDARTRIVTAIFLSEKQDAFQRFLKILGIRKQSFSQANPIQAAAIEQFIEEVEAFQRYLSFLISEDDRLFCRQFRVSLLEMKARMLENGKALSGPEITSFFRNLAPRIENFRRLKEEVCQPLLQFDRQIMTALREENDPRVVLDLLPPADLSGLLCYSDVGKKYLEEAIRHGRRQIVRDLLQRGVLPQEQTGIDRFLRIAIASGDLAIVHELLLNRNARVSASVFKLAIEAGNLLILYSLLATRNGSPINDFTDPNLLFSALSLRSRLTVKLLLMHRVVDPNLFIEGMHPLMFAAYQGCDFETLRYLVAYGADIHAPASERLGLETGQALMEFFEERLDRERAREAFFFFQRGAPLTREFAQKLLSAAVEMNALYMGRALIEYLQAEPLLEDNFGPDLLDIAILEQKPEAFRMLLEAGVSLERGIEMRPAVAAIQMGDFEMLRFLKEKGASMSGLLEELDRQIIKIEREYDKSMALPFDRRNRKREARLEEIVREIFPKIRQFLASSAQQSR